ncbi:MAG TPA: ABC transporter permease [Acidimicrobiales bacterium]|nr:ABC transporter permease [Acidimicrobiales bacterium]
MTRRYLVRRLLQVFPICAAILLVGFLLIHLAPGDPVLAVAGDSGDEQYYAEMRERFGLDRPLPVQLGIYAGKVVKGDFGVSYTRGRPAREVIAERVPASLLLATTALVVAVVVGIGFGVVAATRQRGILDVATSTVALGLYAAPVFWVGQLAVLFFALRLDWFPVQGMTSADRSGGGWHHILDVVHHLALPALVLASQEIGAISRLARSGLLDELGRDHIRTARAKGVRERSVLLKHAMRRALLPVVTVIGGRVGYFVSGAVVVEILFAWPGVAQLLVSSVQSRDIPIVLGIFFLVSLIVVIANLLTDLAYVWLDPRIRYR